VGPVGAADSIICEYARDHGFVLITNDLDFPRIMAHTSNAKPSVILLRGEPLVPEMRGEALIRAMPNARRSWTSERFSRLIGRADRGRGSCH
jgi:predicted nuclease of predicted toxin-antitoxin system